MEAVPKIPMISFEVKSSQENTHFGPKLKQYIAEAYREDPDSYSNEIHQLEGLRSAAVRATIDTTGLSALIRYFCQLRAMQSRFPMAKGQPAACSFNWKDLYANMSCSLADIRFEMACILYNIGAMHTELGALEPRNTADSMKAACTHYQNAAWAFQYLREHYPQPSGVDVSTEIMRVLQEICFGHAQECILEKSIQDARKPTVVGAVATQVMYFYKNALALLGPSSGSDTIHEMVGHRLYTYWHKHLAFKVAYIGCIVCLYQGMHAEEQQKMGDRVAFYQKAVEKLNEARKLVKHMEPPQIAAEAITFTNDVVEGKRKAAKNENEFIYHEEVPDKDLLVDMKPVCLVKALPINFSDPEVTGHDLFSRLVPMGAHEASSMYSEEKAKLLRQVVGQVETKNTELTEFMSSLQLDQLDVLDSDQKVPQEIVDRCAAMNAKSDVIQSLVDSMNNLAEIIGDVEHSLADIKNFIQEETQKEKDFQKVMGPRPPSIVQTELSREYHKYQEAHARTNESNQVLHKAMTLHIANLRLLAQPLDVLEAKIPNIDGIAGLDRDTMSEMRRIVSKVREMQTQRDALVAQLRESITSDDITGQLLARSTEPTEEIFKQEIEKHTPKVKIIEQNLAAQENIINKLTSVYASYGDSRRLLTDVLRKRDGLINALITSYDTYEELLGKSQKGLEFYNKLSHNISQLLARLRSTCQVQQEERAQQLAKQNKAPTPPLTPTPPQCRTPELTSTSQAITMAAGSRKLKDYLPYMKNRSGRSVMPQVPIDNMSHDTYYPESIYPTSVRPAPVGSEATDLPIPDGVMPQTVPSSYDNYYDHDPSIVPSNIHPNTPSVPSYSYPATSKAFDKPANDDPYGYTAYTPPQFSQNEQIPNSYNPYYSASQSNTAVTDSHNISMRQTPNTYYDTYNQIPTIPESSTSSMGYTPNTADLAMNFSQMQVSNPKTDFGNEYSQTFYSIHYPNVSTPNPASYTNAPQNSATSIAHSQIPTGMGSLNYPYSSEAPQYDQGVPNVPFSTPTDPYGYTSFASTSQGYTHANAGTSTSVASNPSTASYPYNSDVETYNPALAQLEAFDKPIKSHVTGQALSAPSYQPGYENYPSVVPSFASQPETLNTQNPTNAYPYSDQTNYNQDNQTYSQNYQNHPGYNFNTATGSYDYNYGSQNSYTGYDNAQQANMIPNTVGKDQNWSAPGIYTSAGTVGTCETVQSPTETHQVVPQLNQGNNQMYYTPYGYQPVQNETPVPAPVSQQTTYNTNQSTYIQPDHNPSTYAQVSTTIENPEPIESVNTEVNNTTNEQNIQSVQNTDQVETKITDKEEKADLSAFDLLSDIDFTVKHTPLMPEIKVPQISESAIRKPVIPKTEPVKKVLPVKEEVIERPPKRDLFSDPGLVNQFTQEVKKLQKLTDSLTDKTPSGLTLLDAKWKSFQDVQSKESAMRTRRVAMEHTRGNILTEVVPYDDSRLTLKADPDAYINASYYKQLAPWCIPLVLSKNPIEREYSVFWKAILEQKISCIVCLLSEIEIQGNVYWPTAKGQTVEFDNLKVVLNEVTCNVHWTERKITVSGKTVLEVTHYQINVFPAKIACSPLVLLADAVLSSGSSAWLQCASGGRSALLALLLMLVSQVRAGYVQLTDMLDAGCVTLYKHRTNVLEDTKYLVDAYRTALYYVQGVLCSGTTMFNGEAVVLPTGAGVLPPVQPSTSSKPGKFSKESFEEMKQSPGLKSGDMKDPLNFLDPLWSLKKK